MGRHSNDKSSRRRYGRNEEGEDIRSGDDGAAEEEIKKKKERSREDESRRRNKEKRHHRGEDDQDEYEEEGEARKRHRDDDDASDTGDRRRHKKHRRRGDDDDDSDRHNRKRSSRKHRHRRKEDLDDKDRKRGRKHHRKDASDEDRKSRKHQKKNRRDHDDDDEARSRKKDKKKKKEKSDGKPSDKGTFISLGPPLGKSPDKLLDAEEDYFAYHEHLWMYVYREQGRPFNDMTSDESRMAFRDFVRRYNKGELAEGYYVEKLPAKVLEESKTTQHSWSFRMTETEGRGLRSIEAGVRKQTEYRDPVAEAETSRNRDVAQDQDRSGDQSRTDIAQERLASRRLKEHIRVAEEEFGGGRKEGRERQIEKRKEAAARIHGAARDREGAAGVPEIGDAVLYGGDDRKQFARQKERSAQRQESRDKRLTELQIKEKERQEAMFKQLGLSNIKPGQKITTQPRKDA